MLLERLFENLAVEVEPFAVCVVSSDWRLRMGKLDWVTLHFVLHGEGELRIGKTESKPLATHSLALVPKGLTHAIQGSASALHESSTDDGAEKEAGLLRFVSGADGDRDLLVACGRLQAIYGGGLGLFDLLDEPVLLDFADSQEMAVTFSRLLEESRNLSPGSRAMMAALMNECLVHIFRRLSDGSECRLPWLDALQDPRMATVLSTVLARPENPHSLDTLAAKAMMSRSAFAQQFAALFGRTPMSFVRDVRLRHAAQLLMSTHLPVDTIASRVGFSSRSHFSRAFHDYFGQSPRDFRARPLFAGSN